MQNNPLIQGLQSSGATITAQRIAICKWLYENHMHPTVADVHTALHDTFPTMSLATVYNTLSLLETLGLIYQVGLSPEGTKRYDVNTKRHINLVCQNCGKILDVYDDELLNKVAQTMKALGFQAQEVIVHGLCTDCESQSG
jgi:Fur family peroxide stress response transcriptional regulator